jgi:ABC-type phosphate/phosphonate transport system permease subunit
LYRWENNIRAAAILGVVGAGGLGQMLKYHLSLFQMQTAATVIVAMLLLVALVDALSFAMRRCWCTELSKSSLIKPLLDNRRSSCAPPATQG